MTKKTKVTVIEHGDPRKAFRLYCDPDQDRARQEHKTETNINVILKRHGAVPPGRTVQYGTQDMDLTLQEAIRVTNQTTAAWASIPDDIRKKFPSWPAVAAALARKELEIKGGQLRWTPPPDPPAPPKTDK